MTQKTVNGAAAIIEVAQNILKDGRPRKPLGKPRPKEQRGKMSLIGALRYARLITGATRRQYEAALNAIDAEVYHEISSLSWNASALEVIEAYDEQQLDTRQVIRSLGKAIKYQLA